MSWVTRADKPEPAILGGSKDHVVLAKEAEGLGDVMKVERRDIAPDENSRRRGAVGDRATHPDREIACALSDRLYSATPMTGAAARLVGRHRDPQSPAPVLRETAEQQRDHRPLEAKRCDIADIARETPLAAAEQRRADEQDKSAPHQP
jgi:hypothetical protein